MDPDVPSSSRLSATTLPSLHSLSASLMATNNSTTMARGSLTTMAPPPSRRKVFKPLRSSHSPSYRRRYPTLVAASSRTGSSSAARAVHHTGHHQQHRRGYIVSFRKVTTMTTTTTTHNPEENPDTSSSSFSGDEDQRHHHQPDNTWMDSGRRKINNTPLAALQHTTTNEIRAPPQQTTAFSPPAPTTAPDICLFPPLQHNTNEDHTTTITTHGTWLPTTSTASLKQGEEQGEGFTVTTTTGGTEEHDLYEQKAGARLLTGKEGDLQHFAPPTEEFLAGFPLSQQKQLNKQVFLMEKKIAKLREKLKRRTREVALLMEPPPKGIQYKPVDVLYASREELIAEIGCLRAETARVHHELRIVTDRISRLRVRVL